MVRSATTADIDRLAQVWYDAWCDAHALLVPADLVRLRTRESFHQRIEAALDQYRVVGPVGAPAGLCVIKDDELHQLFVAAIARGSGVAAELLADGEERLAATGVTTAWLACAIGNDRAARFYEKHDWHRVGTVTNRLETPGGEYLLDVWRYEKALTPNDRA
ncbi:MAG TPA: GNAT family N-acetyltransferase [Gemmatimonadaceae bacterium]